MAKHFYAHDKNSRIHNKPYTLSPADYQSKPPSTENSKKPLNKTMNLALHAPAPVFVMLTFKTAVSDIPHGCSRDLIMDQEASAS